MDNNGKTVHAAWIRIDMDMLTHSCSISGEAPTTETTIAMLRQALDEMEAQQRVTRVQQIQRALQEQQQVQALTNSLKGKV